MKPKHTFKKCRSILQSGISWSGYRFFSILIAALLLCGMNGQGQVTDDSDQVAPVPDQVAPPVAVDPAVNIADNTAAVPVAPIAVDPAVNIADNTVAVPVAPIAVDPAISMVAPGVNTTDTTAPAGSEDKIDPSLIKSSASSSSANQDGQWTTEQMVGALLTGAAVAVALSKGSECIRGRGDQTTRGHGIDPSTERGLDDGKEDVLGKNDSAAKDRDNTGCFPIERGTQVVQNAGNAARNGLAGVGQWFAGHASRICGGSNEELSGLIAALDADVMNSNLKPLLEKEKLERLRLKMSKLTLPQSVALVRAIEQPEDQRSENQKKILEEFNKLEKIKEPKESEENADGGGDPQNTSTEDDESFKQAQQASVSRWQALIQRLSPNGGNSE